MIARLINRAWSCWCLVPAYPIWNGLLLAGVVIGMYWWAWSH